MRLSQAVLAGGLAAVLAAAPGAARAAYIDLNAGPATTSFSGGDFEYSLTANGVNANLNHGGSAYSAPAGTVLSFSGTLIDRGATVAANRQVFVLPYAGARYAVADLSYGNTASTSTNPYASRYTLSGVYRSNENIQVPAGALTIVAGDSYRFDSAYASNTLFTTPVPEPASVLLLGSGLGALVVARRRAKAQAQAQAQAQA